MIDHRFAHSKKLKWLFFPIIVSIVLNIIAHLEFTFNLYELQFEGKTFLYDLIFGLEELSVYLFTLALLFWSYRLLQKIKLKNPTILWAKKLWFFTAFITLTWIVLFVLDAFVFPFFPEWDHFIFYDLYILAVQLSLFVYWVAYTGCLLYTSPSPRD